MSGSLEAEMSEITTALHQARKPISLGESGPVTFTDAAGRSTQMPQRPKATFVAFNAEDDPDGAKAARADRFSWPKADPRQKPDNEQMPKTMLERLAHIRGIVAEFDADIRNEIAEIDMELAALYTDISNKIGTRG